MAFHLRIHAGASILFGGVGGALVRAGGGEVVYRVWDGEGGVGDVVDARGVGERGEVGGKLGGAVGFAGGGVAGYDY
jgi:hypothetical protein